jgi:hypothetical protein
MLCAKVEKTERPEVTAPTTSRCPASWLDLPVPVVNDVRAFLDVRPPPEVL